MQELQVPHCRRAPWLKRVLLIRVQDLGYVSHCYSVPCLKGGFSVQSPGFRLQKRKDWVSYLLWYVRDGAKVPRETLNPKPEAAKVPRGWVSQKSIKTLIKRTFKVKVPDLPKSLN